MTKCVFPKKNTIINSIYYVKSDLISIYYHHVKHITKQKTSSGLQ
jgi:hypothetical protein